MGRSGISGGMDWKQLAEKVFTMAPEERVARFAELDAWFDANPPEKRIVTVDGPSGSPTTPLERADAINERLALAFAIARDAARSRP